jgi:hypothetical protein
MSQSRPPVFSHDPIEETYLEESLEPPHLEHTLTNDNRQLEHAPPFHSAVGALGRIPVYPLAHYNVRLFVLDLCQRLGEFAN